MKSVVYVNPVSLVTRFQGQAFFENENTIFFFFIIIYWSVYSRLSFSSRGKGHGTTLTAAAEPRGSRSLDNRPTTVKVSGLPEGAGEGDLRVHANMAGVLLGAAMLDRPGEGVVKFAERW